MTNIAKSIIIFFMNIAENEYFIHIDDSGKFSNLNDKFVIYGGILFSNKDKMFNFLHEFERAKLLYSPARELKGNKLAISYIKNLTSPFVKSYIENIFAKFNLVDHIFHWVYNKNDMRTEKTINDDENRRKYAIPALIATMVIQGKIKENSKITMFLDECGENTSLKNDSETFTKYLNSRWSKTLILLRDKNITFKRVVYCDSKKTPGIQAADIIVNFCQKFHNEEDNSERFLKVLSDYGVKVGAIVFPGFLKYDDTLSIDWNEINSQVQDYTKEFSLKTFANWIKTSIK